jgi:alkylation response protein AidB-like acyl-CoA dehydrogenase
MQKEEIPMPELASGQPQLRDAADLVARTHLRPRAAEIDRQRLYPSGNLRELGNAGLLGLLVPVRFGGLGGSLVDLALVAEAIGWGCASTAMCFLMHSCGCALIGARASDQQGEAWLRPAARGDAIATLAFSERVSGARFYEPEIAAVRQNGNFLLNGRKSFVTSGNHAHLYPVLVRASGNPGLDILIATSDLPGLTFEGDWDGVGMAGNSSIAMVLANARIPESNLLGAEGDGMDLVFNVVAPTFLVGLAAVNVGIAQSTLEDSIEHAKNRQYWSGDSLAEVPTVQDTLAEMSIAVQSARQLVAEAARAASAGDDSALVLVMQAKVAATQVAMTASEAGMHVGGGMAYGRQLPLERHWRDAHAGGVMAPTNDVLKTWLGKALTGLPLF